MVRFPPPPKSHDTFCPPPFANSQIKAGVYKHPSGQFGAPRGRNSGNPLVFCTWTLSKQFQPKSIGLVRSVQASASGLRLQVSKCLKHQLVCKTLRLPFFLWHGSPSLPVSRGLATTIVGVVGLWDLDGC